jgi:hypothetical protein
MIKQEYIKPTAKVIKLQHQSRILVNSINTTGLDSKNLEYDDKGGDQSSAW